MNWWPALSNPWVSLSNDTAAATLECRMYVPAHNWLPRPFVDWVERPSPAKDQVTRKAQYREWRKREKGR